MATQTWDEANQMFRAAGPHQSKTMDAMLPSRESRGARSTPAVFQARPLPGQISIGAERDGDEGMSRTCLCTDVGNASIILTVVDPESIVFRKPFVQLAVVMHGVFRRHVRRVASWFTTIINRFSAVEVTPYCAGFA